nr:CCR4-NOT transcription complex subunit 9-like isoform X2 [Setaria viridis]
MPFPSYVRKGECLRIWLHWFGNGTMTAQLQEVILVYSALSSPTLSDNASSRVCNALGLLQTVAAHPLTRTPPLLAAQIPMYLYPFLNTTSNAKSFDALFKVEDDTEVVNFLVTSQVMPLFLRIMVMGTELQGIVSTSIVEKIMLDDFGLQYIRGTADRFFQISIALGTMVFALVGQPSSRLLKHVVRCYLRLTDHPRMPLPHGAVSNSCWISWLLLWVQHLI